MIVQFAGETHPAPAHWLAAFRDGKEVERKSLDVAGASPFTARVSFTASPAPDELVLLVKDAAGKETKRARWRVERPAFEADAEAAAEPVMNPVDLGAVLPPADWLVLSPKQHARGPSRHFPPRRIFAVRKCSRGLNRRRIGQRKPPSNSAKASATK